MSMGSTILGGTPGDDDGDLQRDADLRDENFGVGGGVDAVEFLR